MSFAKKNKGTRWSKNERGVALLMALMALLILSAIAAGMMYIASTETTINGNYRDGQRAYFASEAGLEDAREMIRMDPTLLPQNLPAPGNQQGIVYIINPRGSETVAPWDQNNAYYDDEICHEFAAQLSLTDSGANVPCAKVSLPANSYRSVTSTYQINGANAAGTASALNYKWVRLTLKFNNTLQNYPVNSSMTTPPGPQVCWDNNQSGGGFHEVIYGTDNIVPLDQPFQTPSPFEMAALKQAIDQGLIPAVMMFGGKGKGNSTGTTTGSTTSTTATTGSTTSTTTTATTGSTTTAATTGSTTTAATTGTTTTTAATTGTASGTTGTTGGATGSYVKHPGPFQLYDACNKENSYRYAVYLLTSLAITPQGSRRLTQYEIARIPFPQLPGGLTLNGPAAISENMPNSANFVINGKDSSPVTPTSQCPMGNQGSIDAITVVDQQGVDNVKSQIPSNRTDQYTGLSGQTPDVVSNPSDQTLANDLDTPAENQALADQFRDTADSKLDTNPNSPTFGQVISNDSTCASYPYGVNPLNTASTAPAACKVPRVTYAGGNLTLGSDPHGYGVLVVTGDLTLNGGFSWDGEILVIGTGKITFNGGGGGAINGGVYVANIYDANGNLRPTLGTPAFYWGGGGGNGITYNSCYINNGATQTAFRVITYRELTY